MKRIVQQSLLWLMVILFLPVGLVMLAGTLVNAAIAGAIIAAIALVVFLFNYLNRNSLAAQMRRPPAKSVPSDDKGGG